MEEKENTFDLTKKLFKVTIISLVVGTILISVLYVVKAQEIIIEEPTASTTMEAILPYEDLFAGSKENVENLNYLYGKIDYLSEQIAELHNQCIK